MPEVEQIDVNGIFEKNAGHPMAMVTVTIIGKPSKATSYSPMYPRRHAPDGIYPNNPRPGDVVVEDDEESLF